MMKVAIVGNEQVKTQAVVKSLKRLLSQKQIDIDVENPDVVLTVGGDGTLILFFGCNLSIVI